jgi:hypothetical protein
MDVVKALLKLGMDVNRQTSTTALRCAASGGKVQAVRELVALGADVNLADEVCILLYWCCIIFTLLGFVLCVCVCVCV